ncbi:sensor histidine kinase [Bacillus marasmi]|uniref:sensor histidine kinase n=1 Tax=Bacillus marasmi TaxID=1926279 RepID=UPI0011CCAF7B|nr:sensor histidine kinase [Bacillus marasmi]
MKPNRVSAISSYIIKSQEEEMKRVSQELHEGVGQTLYSIFTGLQYIETGVNEVQTKRFIRNMAELLEKTIQEIRLFSVELYPPTLTSFGLFTAMKHYAKLYTTTFGIEVEVNHSGTEQVIPEEQNIALFRVCQEALANIAKYADTSRAIIMFSWTSGHLNISITDFGKGFSEADINESSFGLAAMKERMQLIGGNCHITSKIGKGTTVEIGLGIN